MWQLESGSGAQYVCAGPLVIWYQRPSECGVWQCSAQCTLGNGAFVRGYKLCMVVVASVWYIETSLVVRLLKNVSAYFAYS